jgi:hypothetical protein
MRPATLDSTNEVEHVVRTLATERFPLLKLDYRFFNNTNNSFMFLSPLGEAISSRVPILERARR